MFNGLKTFEYRPRVFRRFRYVQSHIITIIALDVSVLKGVMLLLGSAFCTALKAHLNDVSDIVYINRLVVAVHYCYFCPGGNTIKY